MSDPVPTSADEFLEQQLDHRLAAVEQQFKAEAFCLVGTLLGGTDDFVRLMVEDLRQRRRDQPCESLVLLLTTDGGYIEVAHRIVDTLRHHYRFIAFVIPNFAFSAGTVLALSGDEIWMDYYSRLGPIDPQVENRAGRLVPATGYLKQWQRLVDRSTAGILTDAELAVMINSFDQAELHAYEEAGKYSTALLEQWLVNYKFKDWTTTETRGITVTPEMRRERAVKIAEELGNTDRWHSHGYGISRDEMNNEIELKIDDLDGDPQRGALVRQYDRLLSDYLGKRALAGIMHTVGNFVPTIRAD
jgi:hypothetical protein